MENRIRAALSPADEFVAMAALIDRGETVEAVATRFGVSERHVRQRLRLGKLAPELLDAYLAAEIERIEERLAELQETPEDAWTDALMTEAARLEERHDELVESVEDLAVYSEKDRAVSGVIVTIGEDGEFHLHEGLVERSATDTGDIGDDGTGGFQARQDDEISRCPPNGEQAVRKECGFSQLLVDDLKAHRLQITRAHLATDLDVAFDLALYALCADLFDRFRYSSHPLDFRATPTPLHSSLNDLAGTAADRLLEARGTALDLDWLKFPPAEGFAALAALSADAKQRLFARCIALCLKPQLAIEDGADPVLEAAGRRLGVPFADYCRPTAANYWGRVKKAHGLAIGRQILGNRWSRDHAGDKKPELAAALETAFDPAKSTACIGLDRAAREAAASWLPPGMAYATGVEGDSADPQLDEAASLAADPDDAEPAEIDLPAAELPAFLTEDEPGDGGLNRALVS
jgi:ParB family transcriptional regulator, chromosome partitioning protein